MNLSLPSDSMTMTNDAAVRLATSWAASHHADVNRSEAFARQWYLDTPPHLRQAAELHRELEFFFRAAAKDAIYWQSVGDFTEEATGVWGLQALKALGCLNLAGLIAALILFPTRGTLPSTIGVLGASGLFLLGLLLVWPSFRLASASRNRAGASSAIHSHKAGTASTWEQLRAANDADPNVGRKERKVATRLAWAMTAAATLGCVALIAAVWL
ncbi:hypothetical protein [Achromobacter deleyi]|uniref:hypothetical protein n=1 Tax=Achromobacter deleyi TaxID=1353891 RepID=UPI001BCC1F3E|nr:hypothetical protein [Achromobacter deleyi]QVQ27545.1 hypothetical protein HLG70_03600 [Achromobacter deleyi]